ncbi:hypothetical protein CEP54_002568 [Fusarium duplospermum]|uniref:Uncharacterized protein n=1 Tax=Fusarium duplospermum TaxID=1325734 RepID=A0A428QUI5_9HYPO|nr:hypothetical protein CEP54_002568 [Fusarium duplospermum]
MQGFEKELLPKVNDPNAMDMEHAIQELCDASSPLKQQTFVTRVRCSPLHGHQCSALTNPTCRLDVPQPPESLAIALAIPVGSASEPKAPRVSSDQVANSSPRPSPSTLLGSIQPGALAPSPGAALSESPVVLEIPDPDTAAETDWDGESAASVDAEAVINLNPDDVAANSDVDSDYERRFEEWLAPIYGSLGRLAPGGPGPSTG